MRILVLSDLHSKRPLHSMSLTAAKDAGPFPCVWAMSSVTGQIPMKSRRGLRELGTQTIRGNHDKAVTD